MARSKEKRHGLRRPLATISGVASGSLGSLYGRYVYGDLCKPALRSVKLGRRSGATGNRTIGVSVQNLVSFGEDARGHVYAVSIDGGVFRLVPR